MHVWKIGLESRIQDFWYFRILIILTFEREKNRLDTSEFLNFENRFWVYGPSLYYKKELKEAEKTLVLKKLNKASSTKFRRGILNYQRIILKYSKSLYTTPF